MSEETLSRRAKQGDIDAYEELVRMHQDISHRAAYMVTGNAADAEDAVQEAFVKAYYALNTFDPGKSFRPWLLRIVTNEAHNRRRSAARHVRLTLRATEHAPVSTSHAPDADIISAERADDLIEAINMLPEIDRLLVTYRYFLDLTPAEMAETFGKPAGTIRSRLHRALNRLRAQMERFERVDFQTTHNPKGSLHD